MGRAKFLINKVHCRANLPVSEGVGWRDFEWSRAARERKEAELARLVQKPQPGKSSTQADSGKNDIDDIKSLFYDKLKAQLRPTEEPCECQYKVYQKR